MRQRPVALSIVLSYKLYPRSLTQVLLPFPCHTPSAPFEASTTRKLHFRPDEELVSVDKRGSRLVRVRYRSLHLSRADPKITCVAVSECFVTRWESYSRTMPGHIQELSSHERCFTMYNAVSHELYSPQVSQQLIAVELLSALCTNG